MSINEQGYVTLEQLIRFNFHLSVINEVVTIIKSVVLRFPFIFPTGLLLFCSRTRSPTSVEMLSSFSVSVSLFRAYPPISESAAPTLPLLQEAQSACCRISLISPKSLPVS